MAETARGVNPETVAMYDAITAMAKQVQGAPHVVEYEHKESYDRLSGLEQNNSAIVLADTSDGTRIEVGLDSDYAEQDDDHSANLILRVGTCSFAISADWYSPTEHPEDADDTLAVTAYDRAGWGKDTALAALRSSFSDPLVRRVLLHLINNVVVNG